MPTLTYLGVVLGGTPIIAGALWAIAQLVARWLIADQAKKRRAANRYKDNGRG
jgi:hypothetical protein